MNVTVTILCSFFVVSSLTTYITSVQSIAHTCLESFTLIQLGPGTNSASVLGSISI